MDFKLCFGKQGPLNLLELGTLCLDLTLSPMPFHLHTKDDGEATRLVFLLDGKVLVDGLGAYSRSTCKTSLR